MGDITAEGIKQSNPEVAKALAEEGKQQAKQDQQEHDLSMIEAVLGTGAKDQVKGALDTGMTADQLQQAKQLFGGKGEEDKDGKGPSRKEILAATEQAHGEEGVRTGGEEPKKTGLSEDAKRRAKENEGGE